MPVRQSILDSTALNVPDISDHRMVRTRVRICHSWPRHKPKAKRYNLETLSNTARVLFQIKLANRFSSLKDISEPEDIFTEVITGILATANEILPQLEPHSEQWISRNTKEAIKHKHQMRKEHRHTSDEYRPARGVAKTMVQQDRLKQIEKDIDKVSTVPPHKQYYAALKRLQSKPKHVSWGLKDKNRNIVTDKERVLERWAEFYEDLYNDTPSGRNNENSSQDDDPIPAILKSEVENAVLNVKIGKSSGLDDIYSEYIKAGGEPLVQALLYL